jgi:hypothetical protein
MFVREDWTLFRSLGTLGEKAGVSVHRIADLVAKEVADNALDEAGSCHIEVCGNGFKIRDHGRGIPGDDDAVASLFSINRPLTSSKLLRKPLRGALGNGLRVVTGAVVSTGGELRVSTRGRTLQLIRDHDTGDTLAENLGPWNEKGTLVEVSLGDRLLVHPGTLDWARKAIGLILLCQLNFGSTLVVERV